MRRYLTALSILLLTAPALAADGRVDVKAQARTVDGVGRILLEPEEPLAPEIRLDGSNLIVRFERPVKLNLADAVRPLAAFVAGVTRSADGRSFTLGLRQAVTLHTQPANGAVVIDLAPAAVPAAAEPQPAPIALAPLPAVRVRSGLHPGFVRVVFDWPQPVPFDVTESDGTLTLGFDRAAKLDISGVNPRHALFVRPPSADPAGGKTFATIVLPPGTGVRHFRAGNRIVVDLLKPGRDERAAAPEKDQPPPETRDRAAARGGEPRPAAPAAPEAAAKRERPTANGEARRPQPPDAGRPTGAGPQRAEPPPAARADAAEPPGGAVAPAPARPPEAAPARTAEAPATAPPRPQVESTTQPGLTLQVAPDGEGVVLTFPWPQAVKAAVFRRAGLLWVVFDRPVRVDLAAAAGPGVVQRAEQVPHPAATVLHFDLAAGYEPAVRRDGAAWSIALRSRPAAPGQALPVQRGTGGGRGPRIVIPAAAPAEPVEIADPEVGDRLFVVPLPNAEMGVAEAREFPELRLLATAQGIAVVPFTEALRVASREREVEIITERGLYLNEDVRDGAPPGRQRTGVRDDGIRLFDLPRWARGDRRYNEARQELQQAVARAPQDSVNAARLELARFYFARGFGAEAAGELAVAAEAAPALAEEPAFRALRGASNLLADNLAEAEQDLFHPGLDGDAEAALWRGALRAKQGDAAGAVANFRAGWKVLTGYPGRLRDGFALLAAAAALDREENRLAESWLSAIDPAAPEPTQSRRRVLHGRLLASRGAAGEAVAQWERAIAGPDRLARAQAALAKVGLQLRNGTMDRRAATEELERLRFAWRGDRIEFEVLQLLGETYLANGDHREGLATLREAASIFAGSPEAERLTERMQAAFRDLFVRGEARKLPPLKAMALYDEFRDLTPAGEEGNAVLRNLAARLVALDLLEPAAALLDGQVKELPAGAARAEAAAALALVRLFDRKPDKALEALDRVAPDGAAGETAAKLRHLRARALAELARPSEALAALAGDASRQADALRADIYWKAGDWANAARSYERLTGAFADRGEALTPEQARTVLKLGVALSLAGERGGLRALADRYGKRIAGTPQEAAFRLVTAGQPAPGQSLQSVATALAGIDSFQDYLKSYRDALERSAAERQG